MSALTDLRDHARHMAGRSDVSAADAALWFAIAALVDAHLAQTEVVDLFGGVGVEPEPEGAA